MYATSDGGSTFVQVNAGRGATGRNFNSEGVKALAIPPVAAQSRLPRAVPARAIRGASITATATVVASGAGAYSASGLRGVAGGGGSGTPAPGSSAGAGGGASSGSGASATPKPTLRISAPKWDKAKRTIAASVTASKAGKVTLTVSSKVKGKLKVVATSSATVKAGANAVKFKVAAKLKPGTYTLVVSGSGATGTSSLKVR